MVGPHPIATGWYKVRLDGNEVTPYALWSAPGDRLVRIDDPSDGESEQFGLLLGATKVQHFP